MTLRGQPSNLKLRGSCYMEKWNIKLHMSDLGFLLCSLRCHEQRLMCESGMNAFNSLAADEHLACGCYGDVMIFKKLQKVVISTPMWENVKILFPLGGEKKKKYWLKYEAAPVTSSLEWMKCACKQAAVCKMRKSSQGTAIQGCGWGILWLWSDLHCCVKLVQACLQLYQSVL